ncbi:Translation initiation factor IF-2 [Rubripirellula lacrimiformis]|uniref:Translation initiation factor IF-2 n=1 Tax=Rubripirellula lacrimiformis TaxID=1930273 RepID=A0A517NHZ8_9BACT|nr:translation initiation factor IF-2 [Rubripirellula lacrimiformis]QDT06698.1 Translation initiation factor IF-2 [Rubripirellula lacrimiformis]
MPARIYALAKELNLDSKELVDIVKKVGITGKGSALASLTDDETTRVREHLAGAAAKPAAPRASAAPAPMGAVRDSVVPAERKPVAINVGRSRSRPTSAKSDSGPKSDPAPAPTKPAVEETPQVQPEPVAKAPEAPAAKADAEPPVAETPTVAKTESKPAPLAKPAAPQRPAQPMSAERTAAAMAKKPDSPTPQRPAPTAPKAPEAPAGKKPGFASRIASRMAARKGTSSPTEAVAPIRRDPTVGSNKVRSLDRPAASGDKKPNDAAKAKRREPRINVKMASLPEVSEQAVPKAASGEPKAQKPDVKLSPDAIAGHRQGMRAPLEQLAKEDDEKKRAAKRGSGLAGFTGEKKRGTVKEEEEKPRKKGLAGMASPRAERGRGKSRGRVSMDGSFDRSRQYRSNRGSRRKNINTAAPRKDAVVLELPCTIRSFSEAAGVSVGKVLGTMMQMGLQGGVNINSQLDLESAEAVAAEMELTIELKATETLEDSLISELEDREDGAETLVPRAPIVTFLGHVDHGKTSLLDYLIGINVVKGEAGGITQHIRAYEIDKDGRKITFVDTPGHEAFTEMRARGANVTDIAVLVVAADDGIMPQTAEAISHAKAAGVPIVVALNKIDLEGVDENRILTQLTEHQLTPSEWGGDVEVVRTSATKGTGMDELLETLLTVAELNEYSANPNREAMGVCIESEQQGDRGVVAKLVVQNGTLRVGDVLVCGSAHGRVRAMNSTLNNEPMTEAGPSTPVSVMGFDEAPGAGERFHVLDDITKAREIAQTRAHASSQESLSGISTKVSFENFQEMLQDGTIGVQADKVRLNMIIRADVKGSLEAIEKELTKLDHPEVEIRVLQKSVGGVSLADVTLASASDAVIAAFNVVPDEQARAMADERGVEIRRYSVIYKLTDEIREMIEGRLKPEERVVELGRAVVKQVFSISRVGTIAGCYVVQGLIQRGCRIRVTRDGRVIGDYPLDSLKRIKDDAKEVPRGMECGIRLQGFNDIKQDDVLEAYRIEEVARTLD